MPFHLAFVLAKSYPTAYGPYVIDQFQAALQPTKEGMIGQQLPVGTQVDAQTRTAGEWAYSFGNTIGATCPQPQWLGQIRRDFQKGWELANRQYGYWGYQH